MTTWASACLTKQSCDELIATRVLRRELALTGVIIKKRIIKQWFYVVLMLVW